MERCDDEAGLATSVVGEAVIDEEDELVVVEVKSNVEIVGDRLRASGIGGARETGVNTSPEPVRR